MKRQSILILAMVAVISISGPASFTDMVSFQGLGDFPDGPTNSCAYGISGDGSPVVGYGWSESGQEAFRWTASGGYAEFRSLLWRLLECCQGHISADDSVVAGSCASALVEQAFHWENNTLDYNTLFDIAVKEFSC